jgi:hypothetical protein
MSAWDHLPNAKHIDWVIASLKKHPDLWSGGRDAAWDAAWCESCDAAYDAPCKATRDAALDAAYNAAWDDTRDMIWDAAWVEALAAAQGVILALIACDDCDQYLSMTSEELRLWATLSEHPAAILLLPVVLIREKMAELALL